MRPGKKSSALNTPPSSPDEGPKNHGLATRSDFHVLRKIWHCSVGSLVALSHGFVFLRIEGICLFSCLFLFCIILETVRRTSGPVNRIVISILGPLMRAHEVDRLAGTFYYAFGCWTAAVFFPKRVTVLAILYLSFVDPLASAIGILFPSTGRLSNGKSVLGALIGVVVCFFVGYYYLQHIFPLELETEIYIIAFSGAIAAGIFEVFFFFDNCVLYVIVLSFLSLSFLVLLNHNKKCLVVYLFFYFSSKIIT